MIASLENAIVRLVEAVAVRVEIGNNITARLAPVGERILKVLEDPRVGEIVDKALTLGVAEACDDLEDKMAKRIVEKEMKKKICEAGMDYGVPVLVDGKGMSKEFLARARYMGLLHQENGTYTRTFI